MQNPSINNTQSRNIYCWIDTQNVGIKTPITELCLLYGSGADLHINLFTSLENVIYTHNITRELLIGGCRFIPNIIAYKKDSDLIESNSYDYHIAKDIALTINSKLKIKNEKDLTIILYTRDKEFAKLCRIIVEPYTFIQLPHTNDSTFYTPLQDDLFSKALGENSLLNNLSEIENGPVNPLILTEPFVPIDSPTLVSGNKTIFRYLHFSKKRNKELRRTLKNLFNDNKIPFDYLSTRYFVKCISNEIFDNLDKKIKISKIHNKFEKTEDNLMREFTHIINNSNLELSEIQCIYNISLSKIHNKSEEHPFLKAIVRYIENNYIIEDI